MRRWRLVLAALALGGWLGALVSHLAALRADRELWTVRRNRFLLLSSLCTNTLAFTSVYRYARRQR
jgi:hypothetical protein